MTKKKKQYQKIEYKRKKNKYGRIKFLNADSFAIWRANNYTVHYLASKLQWTYFFKLYTGYTSSESSKRGKSNGEKEPRDVKKNSLLLIYSKFSMEKFIRVVLTSIKKNVNTII
jgi:hypothetical protein